ncbi:hypothetical protein INS49_014818 [Diaporthe citri]|uniref:uncharacterized protein n=1 Tax=Diaporthe citri TaxID=83186 RepID=UPI001C815FED|nr:uncharacterized protein INS49_014818 [Diaporthe citri]KAG6356943.1 hypothetical protein INS49_014818 [Diaporthe citri]
MDSLRNCLLSSAICLLSATEAYAAAQNTTALPHNTTLPQNTTAEEALVGWDAGPARRGTLRLLWSCIATMFTCTWTVLHMNVPGYNDSPMRRLTRKMKWLAINVLFPEFIFSKAVCDLRLALDELRRFDEGLRIHGPIEWKRGHCKGSWEIKYPAFSSIIFRLLLLKWPPAHSSELSSASGPFSTIRRSHSDIQPTSSVLLDQNSDESGKQTVPNEDKEESGPNNEKLATGSTPDTELKNPEWTVVHSYYAQMGGILCLHKYAGCAGLTGCFPFASPAMIWAFDWDDNQHPLQDFALRAEDIQDRSKADWLAKGVSMLQITWLIINVLVRGVTGLPVTQLEISAFAFAVMAIGIYVANWWKPKDVLRPTVQSASFKSYGMNDMGTVPFVQSFTDGLHWLRTTRNVNSAPKSFWEWNFATARRVENDLVWMDGEPPYFFVMVGLSSLAFGGMHCIAWNSKFPTTTELVCWRVASLISAILPATVLGINLVLDYISNNYGKCRWNNAPIDELCEDTARVLANCSSMVYMTARLTVITLMFTCLRAAPVGVYQMTPWTRFLPRIS